MKKEAAAILLATLASHATAGEQSIWTKPITFFQDQVMDTLAEGEGGLANGAKKYQRKRNLERMEATRSEHRTVKECIKPGNVIDDDVQECVRGYRERTW